MSASLESKCRALVLKFRLRELQATHHREESMQEDNRRFWNGVALGYDECRAELVALLPKPKRRKAKSK